jgi:hypothetical protein
MLKLIILTMTYYSIITAMLKLTICTVTHSRHAETDDFDEDTLRHAEMADLDYDILQSC